jgi:hypothetical protein
MIVKMNSSDSDLAGVNSELSEHRQQTHTYLAKIKYFKMVLAQSTDFLYSVVAIEI